MIINTFLFTCNICGSNPIRQPEGQTTGVEAVAVQ
jgi:hypothetical protein